MSHRFNVGDHVILGQHEIDRFLGAPRAWVLYMDNYVGRVATITGQYKYMGEQAYYVDIDGGKYFWYETVLKHAINNPNQKCIECNISAPHAAEGQYTCSFCLASKELDAS